MDIKFNELNDVGFYKMNNKYNKIIIDIGEPILINKKRIYRKTFRRGN